MATDLHSFDSSRPLFRLGRYEIIRKLGVGGMARVYLAVQRGPFGADKVVVVKQLRPEVADDPVFISQFANEARIALRLNHPNVVHTYDVVAEPGAYFMALEFLNGHSLAEVIRHVGPTRMPLNETLWILTHVLAGLQYAHDLRTFDGKPLGIVHRDVSPSNVFVTYDGEVKLLDFGIAKATSVLSSTQHGIVKGKVGYAAPEQLTSDAVDARSDVYAAGVMLWEAIARRRMWTGGSYLATLQARMSHAEPASLRELCPNVPPALLAICERALSPRPADRQPTAHQLQRDIETFLSTVDPPPSIETLRAFMTAHFPHDRLTLRHDLARSVVPVSLATHAEPRPPDSEVHSRPPRSLDGRTPRRWRLVGVIALVLCSAVLTAGIWAHKGSHAWSPHAAAVPSPPPAPSEPSAWSAPETARLAATSDVTSDPGVVTSPVRRSPSAPRAAGRTQGAEGTWVRSVHVSFPQSVSSSRAKPVDVAGHPTDEPGTNLHLRGYAKPARSIDERDPYAP